MVRCHGGTSLSVYIEIVASPEKTDCQHVTGIIKTPAISGQRKRSKPDEIKKRKNTKTKLFTRRMVELSTRHTVGHRAGICTHTRRTNFF
jgi:hypothetical protein